MKMAEEHIVKILMGFAAGKTARATWDAERKCFWTMVPGCGLIGYSSNEVDVIA